MSVNLQTLFLIIGLMVTVQGEVKYIVASSQMTLPNARSYCRSRGRFLAKPQNQADTDSIRALLPGGNVRAWLGIHQQNDMTWRRDDGGSMGWTNWNRGEGNDRRGTNAGAAMVWQSGWVGQWYDMENYDGRRHYVVCELSSEGYRQYRLIPTELRGCRNTGCGCWIEMAEIMLYDASGNIISWDAISEMAGGCRENNNAVSSAFDGLTGGAMYASGRWTSYPECHSTTRGCVGVYMTKNTRVEVASYSWVSGTERNADPISWRLEARNGEDPSDQWVLLHEKTNAVGSIGSQETVGRFYLGNYRSLYGPAGDQQGTCRCHGDAQPPETFTYLASGSTNSDCRAICDEWIHCIGYSWKEWRTHYICHLFYEPGTINTINTLGIGQIGNDGGWQTQHWGQNWFSNRANMDTNCRVTEAVDTPAHDGCHLKTLQDPCENVVCTPISQCHTAGTCNNGVCSDPFAPIGTTCDDGDLLTVRDVCNGNGSCLGTVLSAQPSTAPSNSPTLCPTPQVDTFSADLIDTSDSSVKPNGRIYLDFGYSKAIVSELNITMDNSIYDYSSDLPHGWVEDFGMCRDSVNREFTYNELQKAVHFDVTTNGDVNFAVTTNYEYTTHETVTVNGNTYTWGHQNTVEKDIPFKMNLPKTSSVTVAFKSNQKDISGNFTFKTHIPTPSFPSMRPTALPSRSPSMTPSTIPTISKPTLSPSLSPSYSPTTEEPSVSPSNDPSKNPSVQPSTQPSVEPSFCPSVSPSNVPSVSPSNNPSVQPTVAPSFSPTTSEPTENPSPDPTSSMPSSTPSWSPSLSPSSGQPTMSPSTEQPTTNPSSTPSVNPSHQPSFSPTTDSPSRTPSVVPTAFPTFTSPSSMPTLTPSVNFPTQFPSARPSASPSKVPTIAPSYMPTTMEPSRSPLPSSDIVTTIVPHIAVETRRPGQDPLIEIQYTTIIKSPWILTNPVASGNAINGGTKFEVIREGACTQFSELPIFLQDESLYCQEWNLQFEGDRHCNKNAREVNVAYTATEPNGRQDALAMSWDIDLGSSAAFECAIDLGTFQIALQIEGASGGNKNFDTPGKAFIDDWYFLRVGASSGAPVTKVEIDNLDILSAGGSYICRNCQSEPELKLGISDWSPDNFVVHMMLASSLFKGHVTATLDFTFTVEMSPNTNGRRRLQETEQKVEQKLTLALEPGSGEISQAPETQPYPYSNSAPTAFATLLDDPEIPVVTKELDSTSTNISTSSSSSSTWTYVVIGIGCGLILIMLGAYYYKQDVFHMSKDEEFNGTDKHWSLKMELPKATSPYE